MFHFHIYICAGFLLCLLFLGIFSETAKADIVAIQQEKAPQNPPPFVPNLPEDVEPYMPSPPVDEPSLWDDLRRFFGGEDEQAQEAPAPEVLELGPGCTIDEEALEEFYKQYEMM